MKVNSHAGHGRQDSKSCGAYTNMLYESIENRDINKEFINIMRKEGQTVYDCTVDYPNSKSDCINKIVKLCNSHKVDLDISWHFNDNRNDPKGDGKIGGVEIWLYDNSSNSPVKEAERILKSLASLGFTNRGIKYSKDFGVLRNTNAPAMIIEVCFVDDKDDVELYKKVKKQIPVKVAEAILNKKIGDVNNMSSTKIKVKIDGKYYELEGIFLNDKNYLSVRELEKANFKISNEGNVAVIESPCCCKK